jgi:hypothetical protein
MHHFYRGEARTDPNNTITHADITLLNSSLTADIEGVPSALQSTAVKQSATSPAFGSVSPRRNLSADLFAESPRIEIKSSSLSINTVNGSASLNPIAAQGPTITVPNFSATAVGAEAKQSKSIFGNIPSTSMQQQPSVPAASVAVFGVSNQNSNNPAKTETTQFAFGQQAANFNFNRPLASRPREGLFRTLPPVLRPQVRADCLLVHCNI